MRIAIIGVGRLGTILADVLSEDHEVILFDKEFKNAEEVASEVGGRPMTNLEIARAADMAILALKPEVVEEVAKQLKDARLVVSCAARVPISKFESLGVKNVIRVVPNICIGVKEAVLAYSVHPEIERKERVFLAAFKSLGMCVKSEEEKLESFKAVSGAGPAFLAYMANAILDEAVANGLDRETARKCTAQTMIGTGKLMESGWSAKKIMERAARPGGSTEAGLNVLSDKAASDTIKEAVRLTTRKARRSSPES